MKIVKTKKLVKKLMKELKKVKALKDKMEQLSDEELRGLTDSFRERYDKGEALDKILPEAFAAMCEADKRVLGMYPFDVQILAGIALHQGYLAEMNTGEGKTLTATLPMYLNGLTKKGAILVTNNEYLALRDAEEMGPAYEFMGLTIKAGVKRDEDDRFENEEKKEIYASDIVYTTHSALGFDYLINNLVKSAKDRFLREFNYIIIDEAHRGYILDKEISEDEENIFENQLDYQSKYRSVIEYFDAVRIALTATPALHTTKIFGAPIFKYSYREAVIDGYLVDYDAPHIVKTKLSVEGIHYKQGDNIAIYDPTTGEIMNSELLDDELNFDVENFNRQVVNENFNRTVLEEIAKDIDPEVAGKTLIYAVDDKHADLIVQILKEIYSAKGVCNEAVMKITGSVGDKRRINEAIRKFKNERYPNIVVTVDLLTTGIDVPQIDKLVFMRRVKSRILFEQMLGRATRLCPEIGKTHFEIYDAKTFQAFWRN